MLELLNSKSLAEGESINVGSFEITLTNIQSINTCRVKLKSPRLVKYLRLTKESATKINESYAVYLESVDDLCKAVIVVKKLDDVHKYSTKALDNIKKYDILNVSKMVETSIPINHSKYTHRWFNWLLEVHKGVLRTVDLMKCEDCLDTGKVIVYNECHYCNGLGCRRCASSGLHKGSIKCQNKNHLTNKKRTDYNSKHHKRNRSNKNEIHGIKRRKKGL